MLTVSATDVVEPSFRTDNIATLTTIFATLYIGGPQNSAAPTPEGGSVCGFCTHHIATLNILARHRWFSN